MTAQWPEALPQYVNQDSYTETILDPVIRTDVTAGPVKTRLRYTAVPDQFKVSMLLTKAQRKKFIYFYKYTLNYGVSQFIWYHPTDLDGNGDRVPCYCRMTSSYTITPKETDFVVSFSMEIIL